MDSLKKTAARLEKVIGRKIEYFLEEDAPQLTGKTSFRFTFQGTRYLGTVEGVDALAGTFASLLPAQLEGGIESHSQLSKTDFFHKALLGELSTAVLYQYSRKYNVQDNDCFVAVIETDKLIEETAILSAQYGENGLDVALDTHDGRIALVRFVEKKDELSAQAYAEYLAQFIKEELGVDVRIGVGPIVVGLADLSLSYTQALGALRYGENTGEMKQVFSYKDFVLDKILEELPHSKLQEYFSLLSQGDVKQIFDDEEMLLTAKEFLRNSLNVSEAARSMYLHRNTLTYRLDKIERVLGLNIRNFPDALSFYLLSLLYPLIKG